MSPAVLSTFNFDEPAPEMSLRMTLVTGLDGDYYVAVDGDTFCQVEKSGAFAVVWIEE
jgi:endoglucanase